MRSIASVLTALALGSAAALGAASPAEAADLGASYKDEPVVASPLWKGFYGGLHVGGYVGGESRYDFVPGQSVAFDTNTVGLAGELGGGHIGYNAQWGVFVAGVEGDFDFSKSDQPTYARFIGGNAETHLNTLFGVRGRAGLALAPSVLVFLTGGWAGADADHILDFGGQTYHEGGLLSGWVYGGGVELMHSSHISFGVEALHYDFGRDSFNLTTTAGSPVYAGGTIPADIATEATVVQGRLSLHFH
jgi:outer membrane immunogenic protein